MRRVGTIWLAGIILRAVGSRRGPSILVPPPALKRVNQGTSVQIVSFAARMVAGRSELRVLRPDIPGDFLMIPQI